MDDLVWAADPLPGSEHDVRALDISGLLESNDLSHT